MSDTAPWEDFAGGGSAATITPTTTSSPPWEDFKQSASQGGVINNNATDAYPLLTKLGFTKERAAKFNAATQYAPFALRESTNEPPTLASVLGAPTGKVQGPGAAVQPLLKGMTMENIVQLPMLAKLAVTKGLSPLGNLVKAWYAANFTKAGIEQGATAAGHISVTGLPATPINPLPEGGESITIGSNGKLTKVKNVVQGTDTDRYENLGDLANALLTLGGGLGMGLHTPTEAPTGITPTMDAGYSRVPEERQLNAPGPIVPQERQLPRFAQSETEGMTQPSSGQVTELRSNTGSQFVTDFKGRTVDVSQLTPWEEAKVMADIRRGPEPLQGPPAPPWQTQKLLPPPSTQVEAGPTTLRQTLQNVEGQLKGENVQLPGQTQLRRSGVEVDPEDLRPAINFGGRILVGQQGDTHADILKKNALPEDVAGFTSPDRGFVSAKEPGKFMSRLEAQAKSGLKGTTEAPGGGLDSMDLPGAAMHKLTREYEARDKQAQRQRAGRGEQQYFSGAAPNLDDIKDVLTPKTRLLLRDPDKLKFSTAGQVDAGQVVNRLMNLVPPGEKEMLEGAGIKEAFKPGEKTTLKEVDKWVAENGPRVEVRKMGEGATSPEQREYRQLAHSWYDSLGAQNKAEIDAYLRTGNEEYLEGDSEQSQKNARRYRELEDLISKDESRAKDEAHWSSIAPKPESDMPGYVEGAVVVPTKKMEGRPTTNIRGEPYPTPTDPSSVLFPSSHSFPPNTLGFFRGYMEQRADGGKTFHVIEVQSDWAQRRREAEDLAKKTASEPKMGWNPQGYTGQIWYIQDDLRNGVKTYFNTEEEARRAMEAQRATFLKQEGVAQHPLLKSYERLALKAAIDHARKEGADRIAVSDAETAMMTEGHDRQIPEGAILPNPTREQMEPSQAKGMRLHYDQTLPRTLEELTGAKGERREFGEHKMAVEPAQPDIGQPQFDHTTTPPTRLKVPRKDLIFRNPDSTPKTSITAREFPLDKTGPSPYSMSGSKLYSGIPLPELEKVWDGMKKWFAGPESDAKDWSPLRDPEVMKKEILESKTATPITSKVAGITLPTEGAKTTLADRLIDTKNAFAKKVASVQDLVNKGDKMYSPWDVILDMLDGGKAKFDGPLFRNIRWPLDYSFNAELNYRGDRINPVRKIIKEEGLKEKNGIRIAIYQMVQQGFKDRMVEGGIPATYIDNVVKTMSPGEMRAYKAMDRVYQAEFSPLQKLAKKLYDVDLQSIKNYAPIHSEWRDVQKTEELAKPSVGKEGIQDDLLSFLNVDYRNGGTKTSQGFLKERLPDAKTMMKLNAFDVYERHMKDVAHFLASQELLTHIAKIVGDEKFAEKYGDVGQKLTMDWLNNYAKQGRSINALPQLDWFRKAVARGVLAFRVSSQLLHAANVPLGMQRAGVDYYSRGLAAAMSDKGQEFIRKNLAETFERGGGELELLEKQGSWEKAGFAPQRALDRWNSQATALGIYLREGGSLDGPPNQKALAQARVETRRAVASPLYKDLPPLLRTQSGKLFMQFQNTFMDQWSNMRYDLPEYLKNNPKKAMGLFIALSAMVMTESGIKYEEKKLRHKLTGYHPKSEADETYQKKLGEEVTKRIPGYGQIASGVEFGSSGVPVLDIVKEGVKAGVATYKAYRDDDKTGKKIAPIKAATLVGEMAGVPGAGYGGQIIEEATKGKLFKPHQQRIQEVADKAGLDLSDFDQRLAAEAYMKETREPMSEQEKVKSAQTAMKNMSDRRQAVMNALSKEDKQWLKVNRIEPPGFGDYLEKGKVRVPYTDDENKFATEMYKSEYENVISFLRNDSGFKQLSANEQQLVANEAFRDAAKRARQQTEEVVKSGQLVPKKKKRFSAFSQE